MEDTKGAKRMENFFNKQLESPISKLEEETHKRENNSGVKQPKEKEWTKISRKRK